MLKTILISASTAISLALLFLALITSLSIFRQASLTPRTTAYFSVFDGLLRVGWFTGTTPIQLICETQSTDAGPLPFMQPKSPDSVIYYDAMALGTQRLIRDAGLSRHALHWQIPNTTGANTVYGTQLRMWIGTPAILLALWPIMAFFSGPYRRYRRRRRGLCIQCGYNLTGNTTGTCPECGTKFELTPKNPPDCGSPQRGEGV